MCIILFEASHVESRKRWKRSEVQYILASIFIATTEAAVHAPGAELTVIP